MLSSDILNIENWNRNFKKRNVMLLLSVVYAKFKNLSYMNRFLSILFEANFPQKST